MPTSISHLGGRARVNEPGRYKKKNNKNLMAQGLPTYIGMPQPLRNLIAKRVKSSQAVSSVVKKDPFVCTKCDPTTASLQDGTTITVTLELVTKGVYGSTADFPSNIANTYMLLFRNTNNCCTAEEAYFGGVTEAGTGPCVPAGLGLDIFSYDNTANSGDVGEHNLDMFIFGTWTPPAGWTQPTGITMIKVTRAGIDLGGPGGAGQPSMNILGSLHEYTEVDCPAGGCLDFSLNTTPNRKLESEAVGNNPGDSQDNTWSFGAGVGLDNKLLPGDTLTITFGQNYYASFQAFIIADTSLDIAGTTPGDNPDIVLHFADETEQSILDVGGNTDYTKGFLLLRAFRDTSSGTGDGSGDGTWDSIMPSGLNNGDDWRGSNFTYPSSWTTPDWNYGSAGANNAYNLKFELTYKQADSTAYKSTLYWIADGSTTGTFQYTYV